jgi:hypothetical protein
MKLWRVLYVCLILCVGVAAHASQVNRNSGLGLGRSGPNTARGTVTPTGGTFGELLNRPANLNGGQSDFERLTEMPFRLPDIPPDKAKVKGVLTPANIAKALRGGVGGYVAGEAFKRLAEAACVRLAGGSMQPIPSGAWEECVPGTTDPNSSTPSDGNLYYVSWSGHTTGYKATAAVACEAAPAMVRAAYAAVGRPDVVVGGATLSGGMCTVVQDGSDFRHDVRVTAEGACSVGQYRWSDGTCHAEPPISDVTWRPITTDQAQQKFEDAVKLPGNASKVWDAMRDYAEKGGNFDMDQPLAVEGPAQSPASTTTTQSTQQTPNGSQTLTTTNTTVINYHYSGDTITVNQTTTSVTRNEAGDVVSSTTTNGTPEAIDEPPSDTPLPPVPDLYVRKYPDGIVGIWNEKSEQIKQAPLFRLAADLMPDVGSGGTCPSWPLNLDFASWAQFGTKDVAPPCVTWDWARLFVIIGALLLARALIFGG